MLIRTFKYRSDSLDLFDRMSVVPSKAQRLNYNGLLKDLATTGLNSVLIQLCVIGETEQQSLLNLMNSTYNPTNSGMTFTTKNHFAGNGSTIVTINTGINLSTTPGITQNSVSFGAYIRNNITSTNAFGCSDVVSGNGTSMNPRNASNQAVIRINSATSSNIASQTDARGLVALNRTVSNTVTYYRNGATPGGGSQNSVALPNEFMHIGGVGRTPITQVNALQYGAWFIAPGLTAAQHLNLYNCVQRYMTRIGAAV